MITIHPAKVSSSKGDEVLNKYDECNDEYDDNKYKDDDDDKKIEDDDNQYKDDNDNKKKDDNDNKIKMMIKRIA